jgi:glucosamine-6-phosphate deaminase
VIVKVLPDKKALGAAAARRAAEILREAISARGGARIIAATGASQFEFLEALVATPDIDWKKVEMFHLDEYVGLPATHPASFRKYLRERLISRTGIERTHLLDGERDVKTVIDEASRAINAAPIDVAFVGIGENAHLAFNDPPADFRTEAAYIVVELDDACCRQQVGEGWFKSIEEVPRKAISMSVRQILKAREILCMVPDARKADAIEATLDGDVRPEVPASILRTHPKVTLYLDKASASKLDPRKITEGA